MNLQSISSVALSGMGAATSRLAMAAHNVANSSTPGFHRLVPEIRTQVGGGVTVSAASSPNEGAQLAEDLVAQRVALYDFRANLAVVRTGFEMMGTLLDLNA
ncbi:MAG: flagellar basal body protein [Aquabacterium sp.]|nr:flagellar basal body protein [Aquabacterium sp.]